MATKQRIHKVVDALGVVHKQIEGHEYCDVCATDITQNGFLMTCRYCVTQAALQAKLQGKKRRPRNARRRKQISMINEMEDQKRGQ